MKIPQDTRPALWGAAAGAAVLAIAGFGWAGWTTAAKAEARTLTRVDDAVVAALAPVCVDRFDRDAAAATHRTALKAADTWTQGELVEKGGWAAIQADATPSRHAAVARACAALLVAGAGGGTPP